MYLSNFSKSDNSDTPQLVIIQVIWVGGQISFKGVNEGMERLTSNLILFVSFELKMKKEVSMDPIT